MNSAREMFTVRCPDIIELENRNDPEVLTSGDDLTHSFNETTSSIASDSTEGSTLDCKIVSAGKLPQHKSSHNSICIKESADILIGSNTNFQGKVVIQNFIAGNEGPNTLVSNIDTSKLGTSDNAEEQSTDRDWIYLLRTYIPCKSKWIFIVITIICVISVLSGLAAAVYILYFHYTVIDAGDAGLLFVCKTIDTTVCYIGSDTTSCSNLVSSDGRPFISGHTTSGSDTCKIYSEKTCKGNVQEISINHTSFYFDALSCRC